MVEGWNVGEEEGGIEGVSLGKIEGTTDGEAVGTEEVKGEEGVREGVSVGV